MNVGVAALDHPADPPAARQANLVHRLSYFVRQDDELLALWQAQRQ